MSKKKWRLGLVVAITTGGLTGAVGLATGVTWKQFAIIAGVSAGKDLLLYLTNPSFRDKILSNLPDDTAFVTKDESNTKPSP